MNIQDIGTAAPLIVICYLAGIACKAWEKLPNKFIPVILGVLGGILGAVEFFIIPEFAADIMTAIAMGILSGLEAVGANQIYKQLTKEE